MAFGSGYYGWAFTIKQFAHIYANKMNSTPEKMAKKLWGDQFYDKEKKKFVTEPPGGDYSTRGFNLYIMEPICKLMKAIKSQDIDLVKKILKKL